MNIRLTACNPPNYVIDETNQILDYEIFGGIDYTYIVSPNEDITVGNTPCACLTFVTTHIVHVGDRYKLEIKWLEETNWEVRGFFNIDSIEYLENGKYKITAYDDIILFEKIVDSWLENLTTPITLKELYESLCTECGMSYGIVPANLGNYTFTKIPFRGYNTRARDILSAIASFFGLNALASAHYSSTQVPRVHLCWAVGGVSTNTAVEIDDTKYTNLKVANYTVPRISSVKVQLNSDDIGVSSQPLTDPVLPIIGNILMTPLASDSDAETVLGWTKTQVRQIVDYTPCEISLLSGYGCFGGGRLKVTPQNGTVFTAFIHELKINQNGVSIKCKGNPTRSVAPDRNAQYSNLTGKSYELKTSVDGLESVATELQEDMTDMQSTISQQADQIALVVTHTSGGDTINAASIVASINDAGSNVKIDADHVEITGDIVLKSNLTDGVTQISGSNIKTGQIASQYINTAGLTAEKIEVKDSSDNTIFKADAGTHTAMLGPVVATPEGLNFTTQQNTTVCRIQVDNADSTPELNLLLQGTGQYPPYVKIVDNGGSSDAVINYFNIRGGNIENSVAMLGYQTARGNSLLTGILQEFESRIHNLELNSRNTLTVMDYPSGSAIGLSGGGPYSPGDTARLNCIYDQTAYTFLGWYEGSTLRSSNTSFTYTMPGYSVVLTARFEALVNVNITLTPHVSCTGSATIKLNGATVTPGTYQVRKGSMGNTLQCVPASGTVFKYWYEPSMGEPAYSNPLVFSPDGDMTITYLYNSGYSVTATGVDCTAVANPALVSSGGSSTISCSKSGYSGNFCIKVDSSLTSYENCLAGNTTFTLTNITSNKTVTAYPENYVNASYALDDSTTLSEPNSDFDQPMLFKSNGTIFKGMKVQHTEGSDISVSYLQMNGSWLEVYNIYDWGSANKWRNTAYAQFNLISENSSTLPSNITNWLDANSI